MQWAAKQQPIQGFFFTAFEPFSVCVSGHKIMKDSSVAFMLFWMLRKKPESVCSP